MSELPTVYGIWNSMTKRFVFGIRQPTKGKALRSLRAEIGKDAHKWRYEVRTIPQGWENKKNPIWGRR